MKHGAPPRRRPSGVRTAPDRCRGVRLSRTPRHFACDLDPAVRPPIRVDECPLASCPLLGREDRMPSRPTLRHRVGHRFCGPRAQPGTPPTRAKQRAAAHHRGGSSPRALDRSQPAPRDCTKHRSRGGVSTRTREITAIRRDPSNWTQVPGWVVSSFGIQYRTRILLRTHQATHRGRRADLCVHALLIDCHASALRARLPARPRLDVELRRRDDAVTREDPADAAGGDTISSASGLAQGPRLTIVEPDFRMRPSSRFASPMLGAVLVCTRIIGTTSASVATTRMS